MKSRYILLWAVFPLLCAVACEREQDFYNAATTEPVAAIDEGNLVIGGKTESAVLGIHTNMWWKARVEYDGNAGEPWCILSPDKGYGDAEITVTATRNYEAGTPRSATIIVEGDDPNTPFRKEFRLTQEASAPYVEVVGVEADRLQVPVVRSQNDVTVKSNGAWSVQSDADWCTVSGSGQKGESSIRVECLVNATKAPRTATVRVVSTTDPSVSTTFTVLQDDTFSPTELTVEKTPERFAASWTPVVGAVSYAIRVEKVDGTEALIDAGAQTSVDLAQAPLFATPEYAGYVKLSVLSYSEDPSVFSESNAVESNSHFTSGKGTEGDPFVIGDMPSLQNITRANPVLSGAFYKLAFTPAMGAFEPLCSVGDPFKGNFDGNKTTLSGWNPTILADENAVFGFFRAVAKGGSVKDLTVSGSTLALTIGDGKVSGSDNGISFIAGINSGTITGITLTGCSVSTQAGTSPLYVGGIAGQNDGVIRSCTVAGGRFSAAEDRNKSDEFNCGGITGYNQANGEIRDCVNENEILAMNYVGGIAGYNDGKIISCGNKGRITANYYFGGISGYVKTTGKATMLIKDCYNTGTLVMDEPAGFGRGAAYVGGITSRIHSTGNAIEGCFNSGELIIGTSSSSSAMRIGGIVGHINNTGTLKNCYFSGTATIAGKVNYGGIVGEFADKATVVENCYSVGRLVKTDSASGNLNDAFGSVAKSAVITSCYALQNGGSAFAGGTTTKMGAECSYKSDAELKTQATFTGWDFTSVWKMGSGTYAYPQLRATAHQ